MVGPSYLSDIAVDDIYLTKGTCCHLRQEKFDAGLIGEFLCFEMSSPSLLSLLRVRSIHEGEDPDIDLAHVPTREIWEQDTVFSGERFHLSCHLKQKYFCETFNSF